MPPNPTFSARILRDLVEVHAKPFPKKLVSLVASAQGELTLTSVLETRGGDRIQLNHLLHRSDVLELITVLSDWAASPDSILREHPDGSPQT